MGSLTLLTAIVSLNTGLRRIHETLLIQALTLFQIPLHHEQHRDGRRGKTPRTCPPTSSPPTGWSTSEARRCTPSLTRVAMTETAIFRFFSVLYDALRLYRKIFGQPKALVLIRFNYFVKFYIVASRIK